MKKTRILFIILGVMTAFYVYSTYQVYSYSALSSLKHADVALVLGAGIQNGELSPVFRERVNHGIQLVKNGQADYLLLTGGFSEGENLSDSRAAANYAEEVGLDASLILLEEKSAYTYYNVVHAKELMDINDLKTALLVSDPFHIKRGVSICEHLGIAAYPSPTPTTMYQSKKVKRRFLLKEGLFYGLFILTKGFR